MSEEQELSVDEILTSIRRILSAELGEKQEKTTEETVKQTQQENNLNDCSQNVFVLSDAMRVPEKALFSTSQLNTTHIPPKREKISPEALTTQDLSLQMEQQARFLVKEWLDTHLSALVEEIVVKEVRALLRRP